MSGHNKWSTIKHRKGAVDAKRGKIFTKIIKEITIAARAGGGDITGNPRLRRAVDDAKAANMPADNVTRAIKKGTGELEGVSYEEIRYEGVGPAGTLVVVLITTDNRNRTSAEIRKIFDKHQGQLGAAGSAAWAFEERGWVTLAKEAREEEVLVELAADLGAEDVVDGDDQWIVITPYDKLDAVRDGLAAQGIEINEASHRLIPKTPKACSEQDAEMLIKLIEALEDNDDVQKAFTDGII